MTPRWQDVRCASIPVEDLPALAGLRREPGIRVAFQDGLAWVYPAEETAAGPAWQAVLGSLLAAPGARFFMRREGRWHRLGEHLPAFDVPALAEDRDPPLDRVILPAPPPSARPDHAVPVRVPLRLARDPSGRPRPPSALRCRLADLAAWADRVPSRGIESLAAAWLGPSPKDSGAGNLLVLGPADRLPALAGGMRYWGTGVLIPLGYRAEPALPEPAIRGVVGAEADELVVLEETGAELVPRVAFGRLSRAIIRVALCGPPRRVASQEAPR